MKEKRSAGIALRKNKKYVFQESFSSLVRFFSHRYFRYRGYSQGSFIISSEHIKMYTMITGH